MKTLLVLIALGLTACGQEPPHSVPSLGVQVAAVEPSPSPEPIASPSPSPSPTPTCKAIESVWDTPTIQFGTPGVPQSKLDGVYLGGPANGGVFQLDLSALQPGYNAGATMIYDNSHVCYYDIQMDATSYTIVHFEGCFPGMGGNPNSQCSYCPAFAPSAVTLNRVYDYQVSCDTMTLHDNSTGQTLTYK